MHTYPQRCTVDDPLEYPVHESDTFTCAEDVVAKASVWPLLGRATYPEVWHLDSDGHYVCGWSASSLCTLVRWAEEPEWLQTHLTHARDDGCEHVRWVIVDSRPTELPSRQPVNEADARAFVTLQRNLAEFGIDLLDAVVFDDRQRWWSLRELCRGSTDWQAPA